MTCCSQIAQLSWSVQQCDFVSAAKILPPTSYELIVGMDWLASRSPMQVDWHNKWMIIPYGQGHSLLQGELISLPVGSVIQVTTMLSNTTVASLEPVPPKIAALITEF